MKYEIRESNLPGAWEVIGTKEDGSFYIAMFGGHDAVLHASEYLIWRTKENE